MKKFISFLLVFSFLFPQEPCEGERYTDEEVQNIGLYISKLEHKTEYDSLVKKRDQLMPNLDSNSLQVYDRMLKAKGHGMVPVSGSNACGNCFTVLPTQLITEIKPNLEIKHCPSCNILLYYDEE